MTATTSRMSRSAVRSTPAPGVTVMLPSIAACWVWPAAFRASMACCWVRPARDHLAHDAFEEDVGGVAEQLRSDDRDTSR